MLLVISLTSSGLLAQQSRSNNTNYFPAHRLGVQQNNLQMMAMESMPMIAPLFIEEEKITSSLVLVNASVTTAGVTISIRDPEGIEVVHRSVVLAPHEQRRYTIATLLSDSHPLRMGSLAGTQDRDVKGMAVAGQLLITNNNSATPSYVDEELITPKEGGSPILRAVTDDAEGPALLAITNTGDMPEEVTVQCLSGQRVARPTSLIIGPWATSITSGCSGSTIADFDAIEQGTDHAVQGFEIISKRATGGLAAFALAPHHRNGSTLFSAIPFSDPGLIRSPNIIFTGVPIGPQPTLPDGVYVPRLTFTNFATTPAHLTISMSSTPESHSLDPTEAGNAIEKYKIKELKIAPRSSTEFVMGEAHSINGLLHSLLITSDKKPGEVQSKVVSRSDGNLYQIELLGKDEKDPDNGGLHPWSTEGDTESHLLLFNHSVRPQIFDVAVADDHTIWNKKYVVGASETFEISINRLMSDRVKDDHGHVLSPDHYSGTVKWMVPDPGDAKGRLMMTSHSAMMARNFSCEELTVICGLGISVLNPSILIGNLIDYANAEPDFCSTPDSNPQCGGIGASSGSASYNNSVSPTSIVRFNSASDQASSSPNLFGVSKGTGSVYMTAQAGGCQAGGTPSPAPTSIATPTNFTAVQGQTLADGTLQWTYSFKSTTGNLADLSACKAGETVFYPGNASPYAWPLPMVASTTNPTALYGAATGGGFTDKNLPPNSYQKPYYSNSFSATQRFQWECSNYKSGAYISFVPDITITRSIKQSGNIWQYTITKSGASATVNLP